MFKKIARYFVRLIFKINLIRFFIQTIRYRVSVGDYVNFSNEGTIKFNSHDITIRDFSEIVVYEKGILVVNENVFIGQHVEIGAQDIFIDKNTSIQNNCILLGNVRVGKNCLFGPSIYVSSGFHYFKYRPELLIHDQDILARKELDLSQNKIIIEDDVWIGKDVLIINNVTVGKGAIIGAHTVINKDVAPYTIVAGSPQNVIGLRLDFEKNIPSQVVGNNEKDFPYFYKGFDYSVSSIEAKKYVSVIDNQVTVCLKNELQKKFITLDLIAPAGSRIGYDGKMVDLGNGSLKFPVNEFASNKHHFDLKGDVSKILVKRIYFDD